MSIDLKTEKLISLAQAANHPLILAARDGKPMAAPSIYRWISTGIGDKRARIPRVRLDAAVVAGHTFTSNEALERFFTACAEARGASPETEALADQLTASVKQIKVSRSLRNFGRRQAEDFLIKEGLMKPSQRQGATE